MSTNNNRLITYYIYEITFNLDGRTYIGQRKCPNNKTPWTDTKYMGKGDHITSAENKYGIENFSKKILAICYSPQIIDILETEYIHMNKEIGKAEFNIAGGGQTRCREYMSEEQQLELNRKISEGVRNSEKHKQAMKSKERSRKLSEAGKGRLPWNKGLELSEQHIEHLSQSILNMYNSPKGEEVKAKIREARANQVITEETKKKISESQKGKIVSPETREKLRQANLGKIISEETKQKLREKGKLQVPMSEESKQKHKQSINAYWNSPEGQLKKQELSEKQKGSHTTKGKHWYNNGTKNVQAFECPEGFVPGRLGDFTQSEEAKQKKRDWYNNLTEEQRKEYKQHLSESHIGHHFTVEEKKKIGEKNKGRKYFNNGEIEVMRFECPPGFVPGRCPKAKLKISQGMKTH